MSSSSGSGSHIAFKDCTAELCPYSRSFYQYRIWLAPNVAFAAIFAASLVGYLGVYAATRRRGGAAFTAAMALGLACEVGGYAGRVLSWRDQWRSLGFVVQTTSLTFAPAFFSAAIYFCLGKVVRAFGRDNSRVPPEWYAYIFIPCDILCLVAQAGGGTLSALAARDRRDTDTGDAVILVGLSLQVATLLVFGGLVCDFALRVRRVGGTAAALDQKPTMVAVRRSWGFRGFAAALAVSAGCVFARCVYRVFEMSGGYGGPLMARQDLFVVFEGGMISVAVLALNVFHPALCFDRLVPDDDDDDDDESRGRDATAAAATATARPAAKSCCDLKRSISVNSFNRDFVGSSLGPGGYDTSSKVSTSSSFDVIPEDAYERPVNSLGRDLTNRFSKCV